MDSDRRVGGLLNKAGGGLIDAMGQDNNNNSGNNRGAFVVLLSIAALLLVVGTEPPKVLLRRRIGKFAIAIGSILIASIVYGLYAWILYELAKHPEKYGNKYMLLTGTVLYGLLCLFTLVNGMFEYFRSLKVIDNQRGESVLFGFLLRKGISQRALW